MTLERNGFLFGDRIHPLAGSGIVWSFAPPRTMCHVQKLELTLNKLKGKVLKFNIEKSFFGQTEMEYLVFWVTRDGVKPINNKI